MGDVKTYTATASDLWIAVPDIAAVPMDEFGTVRAGRMGVGSRRRCRTCSPTTIGLGAPLRRYHARAEAIPSAWPRVVRVVSFRGGGPCALRLRPVGLVPGLQRQMNGLNAERPQRRTTLRRTAFTQNGESDCGFFSRHFRARVVVYPRFLQVEVAHTQPTSPGATAVQGSCNSAALPFSGSAVLRYVRC